MSITSLSDWGAVELAAQTHELLQRCKRIKLKAQRLIFANEHVGVGIRRSAARRAWRVACDIQNNIYTKQL